MHFHINVNLLEIHVNYNFKKQGRRKGYALNQNMGILYKQQAAYCKTSSMDCLAKATALSRSALSIFSGGLK